MNQLTAVVGGGCNAPPIKVAAPVGGRVYLHVGTVGGRGGRLSRHSIQSLV